MSNNSGPVQSLIKQLGDCDTELKKLAQQQKELKAQRLEYEKRLLAFLKTNDQPGLKFQGRAYICEQSTVTKKKRKADKERDLKQTLEQYGLHANSAVVEAVMQSLQGTRAVKDKITTKTYV